MTIENKIHDEYRFFLQKLGFEPTGLLMNSDELDELEDELRRKGVAPHRRRREDKKPPRIETIMGIPVYASDLIPRGTYTLFKDVAQEKKSEYNCYPKKEEEK